MKAVASKSINVDRINSLHQFDTVGIVGVQSPVGKIPIVFYVKEGEGRGRRGIFYYDDYDSICFMYPEDEHAEWIEQPYDIKYDAVETWDNGVEKGWHRNYGILELWTSTYRRWYNGEVIYRPKLKVSGYCLNNYPTKEKEETAATPTPVRSTKKAITTKTNHSCGCRK